MSKTTEKMQTVRFLLPTTAGNGVIARPAKGDRPADVARMTLAEAHNLRIRGRAEFIDPETPCTITWRTDAADKAVTE